MRDARGQIGDIERAARKEVRKNQKMRVKEEKKLHRQLQKEDRLQERLLRKDTRRQSVKQAFANARDRLAGIFDEPGSYKSGAGAGSRQSRTGRAGTGKRSRERRTGGTCISKKYSCVSRRSVL